MRPGLAVTFVCLVVLAGCGTGGSGGPRGTVTPAPVPDGATPTSDRAQRLAPGVTAEGVVAPTRLVTAHTAALRGRSFTTVRRAVTHGEDGGFRSEVVTRGRVGEDRRRLFVDRRASGPLVRSIGLAGRTEQYVGERRTVRRETQNGTVRYSSDRRNPGTVAGTVLLSDITAGSTISLALHGMNFSVIPVEGASNGTRYRLVSTDITDSGTLIGLAGENARNVTFEATVTPDGLVTWFELSYTADRGDSSVTVVRTVAFEDVGTTTVERPPWFANATNGTLDCRRHPTRAGSSARRRRYPPPASPSLTASYASGVRSTTVPS